jgi:glucosamine-6-phosphate deaminase
MRLIERIEVIDGPRICLPTGATPVPMYAAFARLGGSLANATAFLLDEFGLPERSPARCDVMIRRELLDLLDEPPSRLVTWDTSAEDPDAECLRMEAEVVGGGLHLAVVGIGTNGHVGMNEPGTSPQSRSRVVDLHPETRRGALGYGATSEPTWGMTLGIATLMEADTIWLLATGAAKAAIVARALVGDVTPDVPASLLRDHHDLRVSLDEHAAARL